MEIVEKDVAALGEEEETVVEPIPAPEAEPLTEDSPAPDTTTTETAPTPELLPEPEPVFRLPGQTDQPVNETDWLRQQYADMAQQYQVVQQQLQEMQFQGLPDDERVAALKEQEVSQLRQVVEQIQQREALVQWQNYWAQFVEDATPVRAEQDPIKMGHHVAATLVKEKRELKKELRTKDAEIAALKKAVGLPQPGPQVTTGGAGSTPSYTFRDLVKDPVKFNALMRRAEMGLLQDGEIPPIN